MKKLLYLFGGTFLLLGTSFAADPASILQVNVYEHDAVYDIYTLVQQGSAVVIDQNTAVTNAHVVVDDAGQASYRYEVCKTLSVSQPPECFGSAYVKKMIVDKDLAVLKFEGDESLHAAEFATQQAQLGDDVRILGYPANGGKTITQTQGKISGFDGEYYKTDANLDSGNSGGGAFDSEGKLIGIPTFVSVGYTTLGYIVPLEHVNQVLYQATTLDGEADSQFATYLKDRQGVVDSNRIETHTYTLDSIEKAGFEVDAFRQGANPKSPSFLQISTPSGETQVQINTYALHQPQDLKKAGKSIHDSMVENFSIHKNKTITLGSHTWDVSFYAGLEGFGEYKALVFDLDESDLNLSFEIYSFESNDKPMVEAILLFLKHFHIESESGVVMTSHVKDIFSLIGIDIDALPGVYGFDDDAQIQYQFVLDDNPVMANSVTLYQHDLSDFKSVTYNEFLTYVAGFVDGYDLEQQVEGLNIQEMFFVQNDAGVLMAVQPISMQGVSEEDNRAVYVVIILMEVEGKVNQYQFSFYSTDQLDNATIVEFLDGLTNEGGYSHPFASIGVDEEEIIQLQSVSFNE